MSTKSQSFTKKDFLEGLGNFFEGVLVPYFEKHVDKRFDEHDKRFDEHDKRFEKIEAQLDSMDRKLDLVTGKVITHDKQLLNLRS